ncbi:transcriptional regulator, LacI family [Pseudopedobacter saltans DSM 12145]|uniref:Transcriptional regulator, LacI family n=1 Tax=Pseudopedobacter saltans (strain ATCC 51119 / DSM 12145 / JCM 21818 / CCUG 39354 / LMG 10337 / NBRC 100064 / NCIMB 13643) TaxID=762903 RepID=F0S8M6_PSESL|nr:LacI family DNA-binding transcriptional regulator [Pseudopedobacter saltans]ADY51310.1 transcriptional regulator, LacI family [Pseudopedobacter saltans DSM 12145]
MKKKGNKELVGVKEIARRANVAIATVDRVLHNRKGVSEKTKAKITAIIEELNYKPNILARRLASKEILRFAVMIPSVSEETDYWDAPLEGIKQAESEIATYGIEIDKYFFDQNDRSSFLKASDEILKKKYHGILLAPMFAQESESFVRECTKAGIPCVFINSDLPDTASLCYIGPDLYHAGALAAHLCGYLIGEKANVLIVNISEIDNHRHFLRKEQGFKEYFEEYRKENNVIKLDIRDTAEQAISRELKKALESNKIDLIFVANSRVFYVAEFFEKYKIKNVKLVGFEFLKKNVAYLEQGVIDFLICQKPIEQGYKGVMALYQYCVHDIKVKDVHYMPIDIITKGNYQFYSN